MLQKYDKVLLIARIISVVWVISLAVGVLAGGIYGAVQIHWAYIFAIPFGWFFVWVLWVFLRLILSFFCDVKMIRNKLYEEKNDYFADYLPEDMITLRVKRKPRKADSLQQNAALNEKLRNLQQHMITLREQGEPHKADSLQRNAALNEELRNLQQQLDLGEITSEEFEERRDELMRKIKGYDDE